MESSAAQEAACLGAKYVTLGRWPGTSLFRRQVLQPWLPLAEQTCAVCYLHGENWPSSFLSAAGARPCVPTSEQCGRCNPRVGCSQVQCPRLGTAVWVGVTNAWLSCRDSGCSATTYPFSLGHSAIKLLWKESLVWWRPLWSFTYRVIVLLPTASLPSQEGGRSVFLLTSLYGRALLQVRFAQLKSMNS